MKVSPLQQEWIKLKSNDSILIQSLKKKIDQDAFDENLSFSEYGFNGIMSAGSNRINEYTTANLVEAYATFLIKNVKNVKKRGIVIGNDNRKNNEFFKNIVVKILNAHKIKTYVLPNKELMPTPLLSFLIKKLQAAGGINITASYHSKEHNGFKIFNDYGSQLMLNDRLEISQIMKSLDLFKINYGKYEPKIIAHKLIDEYIKGVCSISLNKIDESLKVSYSSLHGSGSLIAPKILETIGVNFSLENKEIIPSENFKYANPENPKSYNKVIMLARKTKSDIAIVTDSDLGKMGVVAKYKRRWKYINANQFASVYLDYVLSELIKKKELPKDAYIIKSIVASDLIFDIAKKYGVKVKEANVGFHNITKIIKEEEGTLLFAFEESYGMLIDSDIAQSSDGFQGFVAAIDLASHLKREGKNIFSRLLELYAEFGIYRNIKVFKKLEDGIVSRVFKRVKKAKKIGQKKIIEIIDFRQHKNDPQMMLKVRLKGGSSIIIRPSNTDQKIQYYIQTKDEKGKNLIQSVIYEKELSNFMDEQSEYFPDKKFSWNTVFKYSVFLLILLSLMIFVFRGIYRQYSTQGDNVVEAAVAFFHSKAVYIFYVALLVLFIEMLIQSWMKYRLLRFHGQLVKMRHIIISSMMGSIISFVTPLAIGGDGIGYWYLRRKGFKRAPLAATFLTSTILYQIKSIVLSFIFIPMGIYMFKDIIFDGSPTARAVMWLFLVGFAWDLFSITMLWILLFNRRFQRWSVTTSIKLLEWFPFIIIADPGKKASSFMYEFSQLRSSMEKMWKSPKILLEVLFYEFLPKILSFAALINIWLGVVKPDLEYGTYWSQIIATDVVNTANSFSLTPGSVGFIEFISIQTRNIIYTGSAWGDSTDTVIYLDIIDKFIIIWPYLTLSTIITILVVIGESRRKLYGNISKNKIGVKSHTTFYKKTWFIVPLFLIGWLALIGLI